MGGKLDGAVVVVTGASSGIGRATGPAFAERGAQVVLASRRAGALEDLAGQCQAAGGQALAVPTDTTDEAAVAELARRAVERFGRIDVWVTFHRPRSTRPSSPALPTTAAGRSMRRHPPTRPSRWPARSWLAPCIPSGSGSLVAPAVWSPWQKRLPRASSRE